MNTSELPRTCGKNENTPRAVRCLNDRGVSREKKNVMLVKDTTQEQPCQVPVPDEYPPSLKTVWGNWVDEVGERKGGWDWFATLTFRNRTPEEEALGWTKVGWKYSENACNRFLGHLSDEKGLGDMWWVRCRETQYWRGVPHWHMFVGGVSELRRMEAVDWWHANDYGYARVMPYQRELGGRFYLCKYLVKELGDIKFSQNLRLDNL